MNLCSVRDHPLKRSEPARSTPLIQTNSPSFKSNQLSIAPQLHVDACESLFLPSLNLDWLDLMKILCREAELPWAHECRGSILPRWHCVVPVFLTSAFSGSWALVKGIDYVCPICSWAVHKQVFSTLGPAASFYISHEPCCPIVVEAVWDYVHTMSILYHNNSFTYEAWVVGHSYSTRKSFLPVHWAWNAIRI